jgi:hypothetical protein
MLIHITQMYMTLRPRCFGAIYAYMYICMCICNKKKKKKKKKKVKHIRDLNRGKNEQSERSA